MSVDLEPTDGALQVAAVSTDPAVVLQNAGYVATRLAQLIEKQGLSRIVGRDKKTGEVRKHVEVGGWQAAGAMFGAIGATSLHAETVWSRRLDRDGEVAYESRAEIRTLEGQVVGSAESFCSTAESTWSGRDEYAVKGMAETRAESRAWRRAIGWIVKMAGYDATPAEEMPAQEPTEVEPTMLPRWATPASDAVIRQTVIALVDMFKALDIAEPSEHAKAIGRAVFDNAEQTMPVCVARALWDVAYHVTEPEAVLKAAASRAQGAAEATGDDDPDGMTYEAGSTSEGTTA